MSQYERLQEERLQESKQDSSVVLENINTSSAESTSIQIPSSTDISEKIAVTSFFEPSSSKLNQESSQCDGNKNVAKKTTYTSKCYLTVSNCISGIILSALFAFSAAAGVMSYESYASSYAIAYKDADLDQEVSNIFNTSYLGLIFAGVSCCLSILGLVFHIIIKSCYSIQFKDKNKVAL